MQDHRQVGQRGHPEILRQPIQKTEGARLCQGDLLENGRYEISDASACGHGEVVRCFLTGQTKQRASGVSQTAIC